MLKQIKIDNSRVHFLGYIPHSEMIKVLLMSTAHVYLTVPFVLSWSMLEAMALECLVIGSDTAPVKEIIKHNVNGLLVDFFSPEKIAEQINKVFKHKDKMLAIRKKARKTIVEKYALKKLLPLHLDLISSIAKGQIPPLTKKIKARD